MLLRAGEHPFVVKLSNCQIVKFEFACSAFWNDGRIRIGRMALLAPSQPRGLCSPLHYRKHSLDACFTSPGRARYPHRWLPDELLRKIRINNNQINNE